jgi:hypothetical protein
MTRKPIPPRIAGPSDEEKKKKPLTEEELT